MSHLTTLVPCPELQGDLVNAWNLNNMAPDPLVGAWFVASDTNKAGTTISENTNVGGGKLRDFTVRYGNRTLESDVQEGAPDCEGGPKPGETSYTYTIDPTPTLHDNWTIDPDDFAIRCGSDEMFLENVILDKMNAMISKFDTDYLTYIKANTGNFAEYVDNSNPPANTPYPIQTIDKWLRYVQHAQGEIGHQFQNNGFVGISPIIFGGKTLNDYAMGMAAACCNQQGIDLGLFANQHPFKFAFTHKAASVFGDQDTAIGVIPGLTQLINFPSNQSKLKAINTPQLVVGTLKHPSSLYKNLTFDYTAQYKCEAGVWSWHFSLALHYEFVMLPADIYHSNDRKFGVNGILEFVVNNDAECGCPDAEVVI